MVVIDTKELIVPFDSLLEDEKKDLKLYFSRHDNKGIVELQEHTYCTYDSLCKELVPIDIRVPYSPDMFVSGRNIIAYYGYAIATDAEGNDMCVLRWESTSYVHSYKYSGGADMWFLDKYDCLVLHGCNEYSVELCMGALKLWKGHQLVLVGREWSGLIDQLPDYENVECFWLEELSGEELRVLNTQNQTLHVIVGMPHEETMERYEKGIMYYDEIMSFTFMFSDYREMGDANPDKNFFVMDGGYGNLGLFAIFGKSEIVARYAKSKGYIPVIQMNRDEGSFYQNMPNDNVWNKFYNQPEIYSVEEVMNSRNVFWSPVFYNGSVQSNIMAQFAGTTTLSWPKGIYNDKVWSYIKERQDKFLPEPEKTLGILARGTDYVRTALHNHAKHATIEMLGDKIDEVWEQWGDFKYIYLATEDESYCEYFKKRYGDKVFFTDQQRFTVEPGEMLAEMHRKNSNKRDGFLLGAEYILSIYLLSKCKSFIASGRCAGVYEALEENGGLYKDTYIFDLGVN